MPLGVGTLPTSLDAAAAAYAHAYQPYLSHHQVIQVRHKNKKELELITTQLKSFARKSTKFGPVQQFSFD